MNSRRRKGYTLFQLVVVVAVLLLLLALLIPAVARVREAAARMSSQNNLKQLGIAVHSYHDVNNVLPAGVDDKNFSCLVRVLPYIEQDNVFKNLDLTKDVTDDTNTKMTAVLIKTFMSPLDDVTQTSPKLGPTNYFAVAGSKAELEDNDGLFYKDSKTRFADITDGLSNTVMFVESLKGDGGKKAVSVRRQHVRLKKDDLKGIKDTAGVKDFKDGKNIAADRGASWADGRFLQATTTVTRGFNDAKPDVDCAGAGGLAAPRSSTASFNVLMGDGSVRGVSSAVTLQTLQALATRSGAEVINDF